MVDISTYEIFKTLPLEQRELIERANKIVPAWIVKIKDDKFRMRKIQEFIAKSGTQY